MLQKRRYPSGYDLYYRTQEPGHGLHRVGHGLRRAENALGDRQYQAARLGQISDETQAVLDRFGAQPPMLISNLRTQVQDLDYDTPPILSPASPSAAPGR